LSAELQLGVEPLEHTDAEFALALDGHDTRVRQLALAIDLNSTPSEVDQVKVVSSGL